MPENIVSTLGLLAVMGLLFYLLLIRPQQRRVKEQAKMMDALQPGTTVMLSSGIIANVVEIGDTQVLVEIAPGLEMSVLKQVIINTSATDEFAADDDEPGTEADPAVVTGDAAVAQEAVGADEAVTNEPVVADPVVTEPVVEDTVTDRTDVPAAEPTDDPEVARPDRSQE
ncbi:preprotein translocase subunit YajC [Enemella sp. A6]|uniref:preprotein translocase subunit YajC n=1 Tax=Enemella sp. A6 TaxID=3440152 RepID=UPI003EBE56E9